MSDTEKEVKKTTAKKPAAKKPAAKKTAEKKPAAKKATAKKPAEKKSVEKKAKDEKLVKKDKLTKDEKSEAVKEAKENKEEKKSKKEEKEAKVKGPKKTKAEINREIKESISKDAKNASRKDRNRAEKTARREAKERRKDANYVEEQGKRLSNGLLAIMIFGVVILMFASVWGYTYFKKDASVEKYINNNGGAMAFSGIQIDENKTAAISADGNTMYVTITDSSKDTAKETKYYEGDNGQGEMRYISSYFIAAIKPYVRGFSVKAECSAVVGKKEVANVTVKSSEIDDILAQYGMTAEDIAKSATSTETETTTDPTAETE